MAPVPRAPHLVLACLEGLGLEWWLGLDPAAPAPFLRDLAASGAWAGLHGFPEKGAWDEPEGSLWTGLQAQGVRVGLVDMPGLEGALPLEGFAIARAPGGRPPATHPPELAAELGDYPPDGWAGPAAPTGSASVRDTAFARHAALARIRFEHARRLARERRVDVLAWGVGGLSAARALFPGDSPRPAQMLAQLDAYLAWLQRDLAPAALAVLGLAPADGPGLLMVQGPGVEPGARGRLEWDQARAWLHDLAAGRGAAA